MIWTMHVHKSSLSSATRRISGQKHASCLLENRLMLLRQVHCSAQQQQQQSPSPVTQNSENKQQAALEALQQVFTPLEVDKLVSSRPDVLELTPSTAAWLEFCEGYGLSKEASWKLLRYSMQHLSDPYTAGATIRWLKQLGPWSDADVVQRLLPCYPKVLATPPEELQRCVDTLSGLGFSSSDIQALLWECPGLLADFREEQLPLITRMVESRRNKYTNGGLYLD